jgi:hypothetical protein
VGVMPSSSLEAVLSSVRRGLGGVLGVVVNLVMAAESALSRRGSLRHGVSGLTVIPRPRGKAESWCIAPHLS